MPAPVLVATPGAPNANTYVALATAAALLAPRLHTEAWDEEGDEARARALVTATALLDEREWDGRRVASTQALKWPRQFVLDEDRRQIPDTVIPAWLELATTLLALALLEADAAAAASAPSAAASALAAFKSVKVGPIEVELPSASAASAAAAAARGPDPRTTLPRDVLRLVSRYLRNTAGTFRLERG